MDIFVKPDAITAANLLRQEIAHEQEKLAAQNSIILNENKMGKVNAWERDGAHKDRHLSMHEKFARQALDASLLLQSERRDQRCWMHDLGCTSPARTWVFELGFDRKEMKAALDFAQVNTSKYEGAVPGFCNFHLATGPALLAEKVYFTDPAMAWGYLPTRWFVKFTDGSSARAPIKQINPKNFQPDILAS